MKLKIYQPFFNEDQRSLVDPDFEAIDLRNQSPEEALLREHTIHLKCYEMALAENIDVWGMFSWKWRQKLEAYSGRSPITGKEICEQIESNPGYDVYFFNAYSQGLNYAYNVWEQGQWNHKHIIEICEELFPLLGIDYQYLYMPMGLEVTCYANYYLGNRLFWDDWLDLIRKYREAIPKLSPRIQALHNGPADYEAFPDLWYFPFIHERLFSTLLLKNYDRYSIFSYHYRATAPHVNLLSSELHKKDAVDIECCKIYLENRKNFPHPYKTEYVNIADRWVEEIIEPLQKNKELHATNT
jgi:hypothetical protein